MNNKKQEKAKVELRKLLLEK